MPESRNCWKDGICEGLNRNLLTCPTGIEAERHVTKNPVVEPGRLCFRALHEMAITRSRDPFKDACKDAWYYIERAIAAPASMNDAKHDDFARAETLLEFMDDETDIFTRSRFEYFMRAQLLGIYMPSLKMQANGEQPNRSMMTEVHHRLVDILATFDDRYVHIDNLDARKDKKVISTRVEIEIAALLARMHDERYFPWPGSPRQESSQRHSQSNMDLYVLQDGILVPIQIKMQGTASGYVDTAVVIHKELLDQHAVPAEKRKIEWAAQKTRRSVKADDPYDRWAAYDDEESFRYVVSGAGPKPRHESDQEWPNTYIFYDELAGSRPRSTIELLAQEVQKGRKLPRADMNFLNTSSLYVSSRIDVVAKNIAARRQDFVDTSS